MNEDNNEIKDLLRNVDLTEKFEDDGVGMQ